MTTRFAEVSEEEVTILVNEGVPQKKKDAISYAVKGFERKETFNRTYPRQSGGNVKLDVHLIQTKESASTTMC